MFVRLNYSVWILMTLVLGGCASKEVPSVTEEVEAAAAGMQGQGDMAGGTATPLPQSENFTLESLNDPESPLSQRIIYFDFNSDEVREDTLEIITMHGNLLSKNPNQRIRLEGHADERGSREFNLSLGERRAQGVSELMKLQGVAAEQIDLISYGEELPVAFDHDEQSWQANRRVEIVYLQ